MKKTFKMFTLFFILILSGCSISNNNQIDNDKLKNQVNNLQQQVGGLKQEINEMPNVVASTSITEITEINGVPVNEKATLGEDGSEIATNGDNMGYIKKVYSQDGNEYLTIDYVQWLAGKEAVIASIEDDDCKIDGKTKDQAIAEARVADFSMGLGEVFGNCTPNGYFIRNTNPMLRNFKISKDADIEIVASVDHQKASLENFINTVVLKNNNGGALFTITLKDSVVTKITEVYRP